MIGIIGAMDFEVKGIIELMDICQPVQTGSLSFCRGKIYGNDVVVAQSGIGKVNAAMCATAMIMEYSPDCIINSGIAGGLLGTMNVLDCVVAKDVCQHDFDLSAFGDPKGLVAGMDCVQIKCDDLVRETLLTAAKDICKGTVSEGTVATGDVFVSGSELISYLRNNFGAIACEMEGGAVGQVCTFFGVPFGILRVISDSGDNIAYDIFSREAAEMSVNIISEFMKSFDL